MKELVNLKYIDKFTGDTKVFLIKRGIKQIWLMIPILFIDSYEYNQEIEKISKTNQIPDLKRATYEILKGGLIWIE